MSGQTIDNELIDAIRKEFSRIDSDAKGRRRVFLQNAGGSFVLRRAIEAESKARQDFFPNIGDESWESKMNEETIGEGRKAVRDFLNAPSEDCIVSGESATSLLFSLSYALSKEMSGEENVVTTEYEHYANLSPWLELQRRGTIKEVRFAKFNPEDGQLDVAHLASLLDSKTRVVAISGVSNAMGSKTPVAEIFELAKQVDAYTVLDAVHMVPHVPVDLQKMQCDFLVFSAYKLFSRRGSFMYGRKDLLERLRPYKVDPSPNYPPWKWEMGTRDQSLFASISAVIDYLSWLGEKVQTRVSDKMSGYSGRARILKAAMSWIERYEQELSKTMLEGTEKASGMLALKDVEIYGLKDAEKTHLRTPTFCFVVPGVEPKKIVQYLWDKYGVVAIGEDFYSRALKTYGKSEAVRASLVHCNTVREVEAFLLGLSETVEHFKGK